MTQDTRHFPAHGAAKSARDRITPIVVMAWVEATAVTAVGLALLPGWWRLLALALPLVPLWITIATLGQFGGPVGVTLSPGKVTVAWLRSARHHYSFPLGLVSGVSMAPRSDDSRAGLSVCRWVPDSQRLELLRGRGPVVRLSLSEPCSLIFQGDGPRLWAGPRRPRQVAVREVALSVDGPEALADTLVRMLGLPEPRAGGAGAEARTTVVKETTRPDPAHSPPPGAAASSALDGPCLSATGLGYAYGTVTAVKEVTLTVRAGEVVGLVGLNGAGKTTTLRIVTGVLRPQAGHVSVAGFGLWADPAQSLSARRVLGVVPDGFPVYPRLTGREYLEFVARLYSVPPGEARSRTAELASRLDLPDAVLARPSATYSTGTRRKLMILAGVVHKPRFLVMDEPTSGLDPQAQRSFKEWLATIRHDGVGVLLSSHSLPLVADCCDRLLILHEGTIAAQGSIGELASRFRLAGSDAQAVFFAAIGRPGPRGGGCE